MRDMRFCASCGGSLQEGGKYCPGCGSAVAGTPNPAHGAGSHPTPPRTTVQNLVWLDDGAQFELTGVSPIDAAALMQQFMLGNGFSHDGGGPDHANYAKGSAAGRALVGGFVTREKYSVRVSPSHTGAHVLLQSSMSGFGGGVIGRSRENTSRNYMKGSLGAFLNSIQQQPR